MAVPNKLKKMKTGIELIAEERQEQIDKHGRTSKHDGGHRSQQLATAAALCASPDLLYIQNEAHVNQTIYYIPDYSTWELPLDWRGSRLLPNHMSTKERRIHQLKVAGALLAAEIDRLNAEEDGAI